MKKLRKRYTQTEISENKILFEDDAFGDVERLWNSRMQED